MNKFKLMVVSVLAACALSGSAVAIPFTGIFSGDYAPANWTFDAGPGGQLYTGAAPSSIALIGGDSGSGGATFYTINFTETGAYSFSWNYFTHDESPQYDQVGYGLNGVYVQLSDDGGAISQSGFVSGYASAGDQFRFYVNTSDGIYGSGMLTVFDAEGVPDAGSTLALLGGGLVMVVGCSRRSVRAI